MTVFELYEFAKKHALLDAQIRVCDGMAVSMYPEISDVKRGMYEVIIDVSACDMIDFDDLTPWAQVARD